VSPSLWTQFLFFCCSSNRCPRSDSDFSSCCFSWLGAACPVPSLGLFGHHFLLCCSIARAAVQRVGQFLLPISVLHPGPVSFNPVPPCAAWSLGSCSGIGPESPGFCSTFVARCQALPVVRVKPGAHQSWCFPIEFSCDKLPIFRFYSWVAGSKARVFLFSLCSHGGFLVTFEMCLVKCP
jgi:hypothetical protein